MQYKQNGTAIPTQYVYSESKIVVNIWKGLYYAVVYNMYRVVVDDRGRRTWLDYTFQGPNYTEADKSNEASCVFVSYPINRNKLLWTLSN